MPLEIGMQFINLNILTSRSKYLLCFLFKEMPSRKCCRLAVEAEKQIASGLVLSGYSHQHIINIHNPKKTMYIQ